MAEHFTAGELVEVANIINRVDDYPSVEDCARAVIPAVQRLLHEQEEQYFRWAYQLLLALAKRRLADANAERKAPGDWPAGQEWSDLVGSSHSVFLGQAREEAGIPHEEFLEVIRSGGVDVEDLYDAASVRHG